MKSFKELVNTNKGFITFSLVIIFLFSGLSKSFAASPVNSKKASISLNTKTYKAGDTKTISAFNDQFKDNDNDADDTDFLFIDSYSSHKFFIAHTALKKLSGFIAYKNTYSVPLYDLFCNWKHYLS